MFAYGSLMWRPEFRPVESRPARLMGWHRAMCILSTHYRGTLDRPGLVLGLDRGGSCRGMALKVRHDELDEVIGRLDARELITGVYRPRWLPVSLDCGRVVPAYAYTVVQGHRQYVRLAQDEAVRLVRQGHGSAGTSRDYLACTVERLAEMGIESPGLKRLLAAVDGGHS